MSQSFEWSPFLLYHFVCVCPRSSGHTCPRDTLSPFPLVFSYAQCQSGISCSKHLLGRWRGWKLPGVSQKLTVLLDLLNTWQILLILLANRQWLLHEQDFTKQVGNSVDLSHFGGSSIRWLLPSQHQPVVAVDAKSKGGGETQVKPEYQSTTDPQV